MWIRMAALGAGIILCAVNITTAQNGQELLQQALLMERAEGNLRGAIEIYQRVVREFPSNRPLVAKALLQLGAAHEKLRKPEARQYYDRVIRGYSDQAGLRVEADRRRKAMDKGNAVSTPMPDRKLWQKPGFNGLTASASADGRYLAFVDKSPDGGLNVHDLTTGVTRRLTTAQAGEAGSPAISLDGKRVAYSLRDRDFNKYQLRVFDIDRGTDRVFLESRNLHYQPRDWTPGGKILTLFSIKGGGSQIAMVDVSGGLTEVLKTFLGSEDPRNLTLSPDGRFIAYDFPEKDGSEARDIFVLGVPGGNNEYNLIPNPGLDEVLGWMPDSKWLLFRSNRGGNPGIWAIETREGRTTAIPPLPLNQTLGEVHALGTTRSGSLVYSAAASTGEVRILEGLQPELARLQLSALQQLQPQQTRSTASVEGVVVKLGTNEPIPGADLELIRLEGTAESPLSPGFAEEFASRFLTPNPNFGPAVTDAVPPLLAPEIQYARTGDDGKFVFRNLKPGKYRLAAALADGTYTPAEYGQRDPSGRGMRLPVAENQTVKDIRLEMAVTGVITGRIFDNEGEPVAHAQVMAVDTIRNPPIGLRQQMVMQTVLTDELGNYRLFWLPPGQYYVAARMEDADRASLPTFVSLPGRVTRVVISGAPPITRRILPDGNLAEEMNRLVYHGGVLDFEHARPIDLRSGSHVSGVDIDVSAGKRAARHIRGVLVNSATGQPAGGVQVRAVPLDATIGNVTPVGTTAPNGAFDITGVFPGSYAVFTPYINNAAAAPVAAGTVNATIAYVRIEVGDTDIENLRLVAVRPSNSMGRVIIEGRQPPETPPDLSKIRVSLSSMRLGMPNVTPPGIGPGNGIVNGDGTFTLWTSPVEHFWGISGIPANTYFKSIRFGEHDILKDGSISTASDSIEIVIGTDAGEISGTVVSGAGPMGNAIVALVPELPQARANFRPNAQRITATATTDSEGRFRLGTVPPGSYKIFAWEYIAGFLWLDPEFLKTYEASGKLVYVTEGTKQEIQVTVLPKPR